MNDTHHAVLLQNAGWTLLDDGCWQPPGTTRRHCPQVAVLLLKPPPEDRSSQKLFAPRKAGRPRKHELPNFEGWGKETFIGDHPSQGAKRLLSAYVGQPAKIDPSQFPNH